MRWPSTGTRVAPTRQAAQRDAAGLGRESLEKALAECAPVVGGNVTNTSETVM